MSIIKPVLTFGRAFSLLCVIGFLLLWSAPAKADIVSMFMKATCNPESQSETIEVLYDSGASADSRLKNPEKDTYSLDKIGSYEPDQYGKKIPCRLVKNNEVLVANHLAELPKDNRLMLYFDYDRNHRSLDNGGYNLGYGGLKLQIKVLSADEYILTYCWSTPIIESGF